MRLVIVLAALVAAACNAGRDAEREYEIVSKRGTSAEKCAAAGKVADAYLASKDATNYESWATKRDNDCWAAKHNM